MYSQFNKQQQAPNVQKQNLYTDQTVARAQQSTQNFYQANFARNVPEQQDRYTKQRENCEGINKMALESTYGYQQYQQGEIAKNPWQSTQNTQQLNSYTMQSNNLANGQNQEDLAKWEEAYRGLLNYFITIGNTINNPNPHYFKEILKSNREYIQQFLDKEGLDTFHLVKFLYFHISNDLPESEWDEFMYSIKDRYMKKEYQNWVTYVKTLGDSNESLIQLFNNNKLGIRQPFDMMDLKQLLDYEKQNTESSEMESNLVLVIESFFSQNQDKARKYLEENSSLRDIIPHLRTTSILRLINATGEISLLRSASYDQFKFYWEEVDPEFESINSVEVLQEIFESGKSISQGVSDYYKERRLDILLDERVRLRGLLKDAAINGKKIKGTDEFFRENWRDFNNYRRLCQVIKQDSTIEDLLYFLQSENEKHDRLDYLWDAIYLPQAFDYTGEHVNLFERIKGIIQSVDVKTFSHYFSQSVYYGEVLKFLKRYASKEQKDKLYSDYNEEELRKKTECRYKEKSRNSLFEEKNKEYWEGKMQEIFNESGNLLRAKKFLDLFFSSEKELNNLFYLGALDRVQQLRNLLDNFFDEPEIFADIYTYFFDKFGEKGYGTRYSLAKYYSKVLHKDEAEKLEKIENYYASFYLYKKISALTEEEIKKTDSEDRALSLRERISGEKVCNISCEWLEGKVEYKDGYEIGKNSSQSTQNTQQLNYNNTPTYWQQSTQNTQQPNYYNTQTYWQQSTQNTQQPNYYNTQTYGQQFTQNTQQPNYYTPTYGQQSIQNTQQLYNNNHANVQNQNDLAEWQKSYQEYVHYFRWMNPQDFEKYFREHEEHIKSFLNKEGLDTSELEEILCSHINQLPTYKCNDFMISMKENYRKKQQYQK